MVLSAVECYCSIPVNVHMNNYIKLVCMNNISIVNMYRSCMIVLVS